ncbi:MAG: DUF2793 domain-containing protein [Hyphomicrobiales bacterium]|nr:DUF2793 domain-containing protein [Hyphomicrobiales bacterium]
MDQSPNLDLPYIMPSQAQKHVTHNEAIRSLDAIVQLSVVDRDVATPPGAPVEGVRYLVAAAATGAWTGKVGLIAAWQDGAWAFFSPGPGWVLWVEDEKRLIAFDGTAWGDAAVHSVNPAPLVGINATADTTNRLSLKSPATLLDQEAGDHRLKINKSAAENTASIIFQSGYSGRAEFGLAGDDDWQVKVSPDGSTWVEALKVSAASGRITLPAALALSSLDQVATRRHIRELLTVDRTYYVRSDGSDANTGLVDSAGGAFLTLQKAYDTITKLDLGGFTVTIAIGAGTFEGINFSSPWVGGNVVIAGAGAASTTVTTSTKTGALLISAALSGLLTVQSFKITASGGQSGIRMGAAGKLVLGTGMEFGACSARHMLLAAPGAYLESTIAYTISGGASYHMDVQYQAFMRNDAKTITLSGTPAFSAAFAAASNGGGILASVLTFSGSATGPRYVSATAGLINTGGGGANYFPGNAAGTATTGDYF